MIFNIFDKSNGTIRFLTSTISERKTFQEANVQVFAFWIKLLNYYGNRGDKFKNYINHIIEVCMKYIHQGDHVSSKEKERAVQVLQEIFQNNIVDENFSYDITGEILKVFNIKKRQANLSLQIFRLLRLVAKNYKHLVASYVENIRNIYMKIMEDSTLNYKSVSFAYLYDS